MAPDKPSQTYVNTQERETTFALGARARGRVVTNGTRHWPENLSPPTRDGTTARAVLSFVWVSITARQ